MGILHNVAEPQHRLLAITRASVPTVTPIGKKENQKNRLSVTYN